MGYLLTTQEAKELFAAWHKEYRIVAPKRYKGGNPFSDMDCVRYGEVEGIEEVVFDQKSDYSFKEVLLPLVETLFYFTEERVKEADPLEKGTIIFLRSCDLHGVRRLNKMYLDGSESDYYYQRRWERVKFVLMGCQEVFEHCFCVDMGTNISSDYDASIEPCENGYLMDCHLISWDSVLREIGAAHCDTIPSHVTETRTRVHIPENLSPMVAGASMWADYDSRCINCGRCNFVCPTCTCFTMQDLFYTDNGRVGERRRVQASCMVDGFSDVAGGGSYRKKSGERMRFKVLHKVYDFKQRHGEQMCVGCGRCDDICPEYISFSHCINRLESAMEEVNGNAVE